MVIQYHYCNIIHYIDRKYYRMNSQEIKTLCIRKCTVCKDQCICIHYLCICDNITLKNSIYLIFMHLIYLSFRGKLFPNYIHTCEIYCPLGTHCLILIISFNASWAANTIQIQTETHYFIGN